MSAAAPATFSDTAIGRLAALDTLMAPARVSPFMATIDTVSRVAAAGGLSSGRRKSQGFAGQALSSGNPFARAITAWTAKMRACRSFNGTIVANPAGSGAVTVTIPSAIASSSCDSCSASRTPTGAAASAARAARRSIVRRCWIETRMCALTK